MEGRKTNQVILEGQSPVETKRQTSSRPCSFGLTSCPIMIKDRKTNEVTPEGQRTEETSTSSWWHGVISCPARTGNRKKNQVLPQEQQPVQTTILTGYWPCWLGPSQCPKQVWYRGSKVVVPEGTKQQSPGTKWKLYSLPCFLVHLRDYLVQRKRPWLLIDPLVITCICCLLRKACGLWRRLRSRRGQVSDRVELHREGTVSAQQGAIKAINLETFKESRPPEVH